MSKRRWITLGLAMLAVAAAVAIAFFLTEGTVVFSNERLSVISGGTQDNARAAMQRAGDQVVLAPDWPWVDQLNLRLTGTEGHTVTVDAAGQRHVLTLSGDAEWQSMPVYAYAPEIVLTVSEDAAVQVLDFTLTQRCHAPKRLALAFALTGILLALLAVWRRRLHWAAFALTLGMGAAMVMAKLALIPHGWDERIHRGLTGMLAGEGFAGIRQYVQSLTLWDIGYLPAAVGVAMGHALGWPEQLVYRAGALCSCLGYASICALAVKHAPRCKLTFLCIAAFPVCIFQAGCFTYDGMVIALTLLGTALLLEELERPGRLTAGRAVALTAPLCLVALVKPAYCVLLLTAFFLPESKFGSRKQMRRFRMYMIVLMLWCVLSMLLPGAYESVLGGDKRFEGTDSAAQIQFILANPGSAASILGGYMLKEFPRMYMTAAYYLFGSYTGWLNSPRLMLCGGLMMIGFLTVCPLACAGEKSPSPLTARRRIVLAAISLSAMVLLTLAQYLASTAVGSGDILGMQERYTLPVWPLMALALIPPEKWRRRFRRYSAVAETMMVAGMSLMNLIGILLCVMPLWLARV